MLATFIELDNNLFFEVWLIFLHSHKFQWVQPHTSHMAYAWHSRRQRNLFFFFFYIIWSLAMSAFFIQHLIAETILTEYQNARDQTSTFEISN